MDGNINNFLKIIEIVLIFYKTKEGGVLTFDVSFMYVKK